MNNRNEIKAKLSILRACFLQSKFENQKNTKVDLINKSFKRGNLRKISEQETLHFLNTLGKFLNLPVLCISESCIKIKI